MGFFEWDNKYSVSVNSMDQHHKKLFDLINKLHEAMFVGQGKTVLESVLKELIDYTVYHFKAEEDLMIAANYPGFSEQKAQHDSFVTKMNGFKRDFESGNPTLTIPLMTTLRDWLVNHIMVVDKKYSTVLKG